MLLSLFRGVHGNQRVHDIRIGESILILIILGFRVPLFSLQGYDLGIGVLLSCDFSLLAVLLLSQSSPRFKKVLVLKIFFS